MDSIISKSNLQQIESIDEEEEEFKQPQIKRLRNTSLLRKMRTWKPADIDSNSSKNKLLVC